MQATPVIPSLGFAVGILLARLAGHSYAQVAPPRGALDRGPAQDLSAVRTSSDVLVRLLDIPRDRHGHFDPVLIAKYQRRFPRTDGRSSRFMPVARAARLRKTGFR